MLPDLLRPVRALAAVLDARRAAHETADDAGQISLGVKAYTHQVWTEPFTVDAASLLQGILILCLILVGGLALWWRPAVALVFTGLAAAVWLDRRPGRWAGSRPSARISGWNTVAVVPAAGPLRERVVLVAAAGAADAEATAVQLIRAVAATPLRHTELWTVFTGCRRSGTTGLLAFLDRHGHMLGDAHFVVLDRVGEGSLGYTLGEAGSPYRPLEGALAGLFRQVAAAHPEWGASGVVLHRRSGASAVLARGHRAVALVGTGLGGAPPGIADPDAIARAAALVHAVAVQIDRRAIVSEEAGGPA